MSFARDLALRSLSEGFAKLAGVALALVAARVLGSDRFGVFALAWTTGWLLSVGSDMGLHLVGAREAVRGEIPFERLAGGLLIAKAILSAVALAGVGLLAPLVVDTPDRDVLWAICGGVLLLSITDLVQHILRGRGSFEKDAVLQLASRAALLACALVGLAMGGLGGLALGLLAGAAAGAVAAVFVLAGDCGRVEVGSQPAALAGRLLAQTLPAGVGIWLSVAAFRLDLYLLEVMRGGAEVGQYAAAYKIFEAALTLPAVLLTVLFPRLAATAASAEGAGMRRRSLVALALTGFLVAGCGMPAAPLLVRLLFGSEFTPAGPVLGILFWAVPVMFVNYLLTQDLIARRRPVRFAAISAAALTANLCLNLVAIPRYGMSGAAAVTIATEVVLLAGCWIGLGSEVRNPSVSDLAANVGLEDGRDPP